MKALKCDVCNGSFTTKRYLKLHIMAVHEGKRPFQCNSCEATFTQKMEYIHFAGVHEGKKFRCDICEKNLTTKSGLSKHKKEIYDGDKPFKCKIFDATFSRKPNLYEHVKLIHKISG